MLAPSGTAPHQAVPASMQALLQALPDALLLLTPTGEIAAASPAAARVLGVPAGTLPGLRLDQCVADPQPRLQALLKQGLRSSGRHPARLRLRVDNRDGGDGGDSVENIMGAGAAGALRCELSRLQLPDSSPWVLLRLLPHDPGTDRFMALNERIDALGLEVARRREAERQLMEQREWLQVVLRSIGDAVIATDTESRVQFMNPIAEALTGWPEAEAVGRPLEDVFCIINEDTRAPVASPVEQALLKRRIVGLANHTLLVARDGSEQPIDDAAAPILDAQHTLHGAVLVFREISERVAAERHRRTLEAQLRNAQKMEAVGTLAGGIAHDFNNVLGAIMGNVALAQHELPIEHPTQSRLSQIDGAGRRARELVRKILTFGRRQAQDLKRQPLQPLIQETVAMLRSTLPATVELQLSLPEVPLHVLADGTQLQQVLMNLGTNAWHALQGSTGRIWVTLDSVEGDAPPGLAPGFNTWMPGRYARLAVGDNGCGMDMATQRRIFEPFFTTKPRGQGTGLGLAVAHGIMAEHRGALALHSAPGAGTRFEMLLPLTAAPEVELTAVSLPLVPALRGRGERVMYVDDDEVLGLTMQALLNRAGFVATVFNRPEQALQRLSETPAGWDIVVSDYNMPQMNGLDFVREVRRLCPRLPLVVASGYVSEDLAAGARTLGVAEVLNKEDLFEVLAPTLARMLAQR